MNTEDFYAAVRRLGLQRTKVPGVWITSKGEVHSVEEHPERFTPEQRSEFIEELKIRMGVFPEED